jgi:[amino group carrier protein]-L-2-aminoadipate 6-kinase
LSRHGVRVLGLAGPNIISAERKKAIRALQRGRQIVIRDDYSGSIKGILWGALYTLLEGGYTPVVAPLAMGEDFECLNVDGDLAAAHIARSLQAQALVILSNVPGLLRDVNSSDSLISSFRLGELEAYESFAAGRMKKKLIAAQTAKLGATILADSRVENPLDAALDGAGTHILG